MSKSHLVLTPCRCPRCHLSRRHLWCVGAGLVGLVLVIEGTVAFHFLTAGDTAASVMIVGGWFREVGKEIIKHLVEDV